MTARAPIPNRVAFRVVYNAGVRAWSAGQTHLQNPHDPTSWAYEAWLRGWGGHPHAAITPTPKRRTK